MLRVALTGNISSGKTEVLNFFAKKQIPTLDADAIVRGLYTKPEVKEKILSAFATLDKKEIASKAFSFPNKRKELESILHPLVIQEIKSRLTALQQQGAKLVVVEVPLLFEAGLEKMFDKTIAVHISKEKQLDRLKQQGFTEEEAMQRINSQLSSEEKVKKSDFTIDNNSSLENAFKQAENILRELNG